MSTPLALHPDRLFSSDPLQRDIARELYTEIANLPLLCPHGHTDPQWFADDEAFPNPADLLVTPDHYLVRMLYSQGVALEALGIGPRDAGARATQSPHRERCGERSPSTSTCSVARRRRSG